MVLVAFWFRYYVVHGQGAISVFKDIPNGLYLTFLETQYDENSPERMRIHKIINEL